MENRCMVAGGQGEVGMEEKWIWLLMGFMRDPCGERNVLHLDCVNVSTFIIITCESTFISN